MNKILLVFIILFLGGVSFAQQSKWLPKTDFNILTPKQFEVLLPLEPFTNLNASLEYNNLGATKLSIAISSSESSWNPIGEVIEISPQTSVNFTLSELTSIPEGYLAVYNGSVLLTGLGAIEFRAMEPLCGTGLSDGIGGPEIFPGVWNSGANVIWACPKVNIGVGTENPTARIHVQPRAGQAAFQYDGLEPVTITAAGRLGIGTNSPQAPVHIQSTFSNPDNNILIIGDHTVTDGSQGFVVKQDGSMYSRRVKVSLEKIPDYVFEKDYELMPLSELELYIKQYGHLPNIPSAQEVKEDGNQVDLGEMNRLLLEKVEELTLYIIELEKRIER